MREPTTAEIRGRFEMDDFGMTEGTLIEVESDDYFQFCGLLLGRLEAAERRFQHVQYTLTQTDNVVAEQQATIERQQDALEAVIPFVKHDTDCIHEKSGIASFFDGCSCGLKEALALADEPKAEVKS